MNRLTKEYKLNEIDNFDLKIGTVNRFNPTAFYIIGKTWIKPTEEMKYCEIFNCCWYNFKKKVSKMIAKHNFSQKHLINYDVNFQSMSPNSTNYLCFDITMKQINDIIPIKEIYDIMFDDIVEIIGEFQKDLIQNNFNVNKKQTVH